MSKTTDTSKQRQKCINSIIKEIPYIGVKPYSHNIITINLMVIKNLVGIEKTKEIVLDLKLDWEYRPNNNFK